MSTNDMKSNGKKTIIAAAIIGALCAPAAVWAYQLEISSPVSFGIANPIITARGQQTRFLSVRAGQPVNFIWDMSGLAKDASCRKSWPQQLDTHAMGDEVVRVRRTKKYTLVCRNARKLVSRSIDIVERGNGAPLAEISLDPSAPLTVKVKWSSHGADACSAKTLCQQKDGSKTDCTESSAWNGQKSFQGEETIAPANMPDLAKNGDVHFFGIECRNSVATTLYTVRIDWKKISPKGTLGGGINGGGPGVGPAIGSGGVPVGAGTGAGPGKGGPSIGNTGSASQLAPRGR